MKPTVRFVWTIPTVDLLSKQLFSKQVRVVVHGKEHELCVFTHLCDDDVHIAVMYYSRQNKQCQPGL